MSWWNKSKLLENWPYISLSILVVIILLIGSLMFLGPVIGNSVGCKIVDCLGDGIHVNFIGQIPKNYTVEIDFPSGRRQLVCNLDSSDNVNIDRDHCKSNGVFFEQIDSQEPSDLPPEELNVTVTFDGKQITKTFRPEYEIQYINGKECPPMCYFATIEFDLLE